MKKTQLSIPVDTAFELLKAFLTSKGFTIFAEIDHRENARSADLDMEESRVLIFGNPQAGTMLMQKDIFMSLDLPLRLAVVENEGHTWLVHQESDDFTAQYQVQGHPVLTKIESLFTVLIAELNG